MTNDNAGISMTVVAVGPGDPDMLTMKGRKVLQGADLVVGFKTVLDVVSEWTQNSEVRPMAYRDQEDVLEYAQGQARQGKNCVVCCWGDLNVSARELLNRVRRRAEHVSLVPCVSSIQFACARAGIALEDSLFITLHKRDEAGTDLEELVHYLNESKRHIILLPRPFDLMPSGIAKQALNMGVIARQRVTVFQRLTLEGEQRWDGTLEECADLSTDFSDLSIMVFFTPTQILD